MKYAIVEERSPSLDIGSNGLQMKKALKRHVCNLPPPELRKKKGAMDGRFSRSSALNLRRKLACLPSEMFRLFGATLTMPAQCYRDPADFRYLFNTFCKDITFRLNGVRRAGYTQDIGFLWRLELTSGENEGGIRTPHLHCIVWTNAASDLVQFSADWCAAVERHFKLERGSLDPAIAAQVTELTSCQQAFQYVANHTSKHKRDQLGWPGRQWGIYYGTRENRRRMSPILNRFDKKPISEVKQETELTEDQSEILAHGNTHNVINGRLRRDSLPGTEKGYYRFLRVVRNLVESQLGRMAASSRLAYFREKYKTRSRRRYYAFRFTRSSTLFFAPETLNQLRAYWRYVNA